MSAVIFQGIFLLTTIILPEFTCIGCSRGWFGSRCQFKCHCARSTMCGSNGECPGNAPCEGSYFGAGCQYVDLAYQNAASNTPRYLIDHNEQTCNRDISASYVSISLKKSMEVSFFRITVNEYSKLLLFTLAYNRYYPCEGEKRHVVNSFVVDVVCDKGFMMKDLIIRGRVAQAICSVYISGGRNVALKQFVNQSSTYWKLSDAKNAVDGYTYKNFDWGSCARTNSGRQQKWTLYFDRPIRPLKAVLYNSASNELHGFTLDTFDSRGALISRRMDTYRVPQPVYEFTIISSDPIVKLQILGTTDYPRRSNALHFCEIEVYGDYWCPDFQYGLDCSKQCTCIRSDTCSQMTGTCTPSCAPGIYGHACSRECSRSCRDRQCEPQSGVCYACTDGNIGEYCSSASLGTSESGSLLYMWSVVPIAIVMLATPVVIYVYLERKKTKAQTTKSVALQKETTVPDAVEEGQTREIPATSMPAPC